MDYTKAPIDDVIKRINELYKKSNQKYILITLARMFYRGQIKKIF